MVGLHFWQARKKHIFLQVYVLLVIGLLQLLSGTTLRISYPGIVLNVFVLLVTFIGGLRTGLLSSAIVIVYSFLYLSLPGQVFKYTHESVLLLISVVVTAPLTAFMVGVLQRRTLHAMRQEEQLKNDQRLRAIIEYSQDAIIGKDIKGIVTSWNKAAQEMYGYTSEEMIGKSILTIFPPDKKSEFRYIMGRIKRGKGIEHFDTERLNKRGQKVYVSISVSPMYDEEQHVIGASVISRNISEHKKINLELRRLRYMADRSNTSLVLVNREGAFLYMNKVTYERLGYSKAEFVHKRVWDLDNNFNKEQFQELFDEIVKTPKPPFETVYIKKDESLLPVEVSWTGVRFEGVPYLFGVSEDVTERKVYEKRKDEFIGLASHELKTPVTTISAYVQLLQKMFEKQPGNQIVHYLSKMNLQVHRLTALIEDLLDISKIEAGKMVFHYELVPIQDIVNETVEDIQLIATHHIIENKGNCKALIKADKYRITQVITNLLNNAIKYSPNAEKIIVNITQKEDVVTISVQDFGIGIPQENVNDIFNKFYRVESDKSSSFPGLGLGLYVSAEIIKRHKGTIQVESHQDKGSTFFVNLPIAK